MKSFEVVGVRHPVGEELEDPRSRAVSSPPGPA
jgi:hypothetical protein